MKSRCAFSLEPTVCDLQIECLTLLETRAYSFCVQDTKPLMRMYYYYYWCACTFASPQGGAAGRNLFACHKLI